MNRDNTTRYLGLGFMVLGVYYSMGVTKLDKQTIAGFSISAFLLVAADIIDYYGSKEKSKESRAWLTNFYYVIQCIAVLFFFTFPFISFKEDYESLFDKIGTTLLLVGLGLSVYLISVKNKDKQDEFFEKVNASYEANKEFYETTSLFYKETIKTYEEQIKMKEEIERIVDNLEKYK